MKRKLGPILILLHAFSSSLSLPSSPKIITKCYRPFGCFHLGGRYVSVWRPFNMIPLPPDLINVSFGLRTRINPVRAQRLHEKDAERIHRSNFNPKLPIAFIIHGYLQSNRYKWIYDMSKELLKYKNMNVIAVDWEYGAQPPYALACANARLTGAIVAYFIRLLMKEFHVLPENIHIIGHSLGAHIAGEVGTRIRGIGRITGLDPAMPFFHKVHKKLRVDAGDANFVDIIHTDGTKSIVRGLGLGLDQPCGHMDFYPNGGNRQPGCQPHSIINEVGFNTNGIRYFLGCNHIRAYQFFTESINSPCPFTSFYCDNWENFLDGKCSSCGSDGSLCAQIGYHAKYSRRPNAVHNKYYLVTSKRPPFCLFQRKIIIKTDNKDKSRSDEPQRGKISINMRGRNGITEYKRIMNVNSPPYIVFMTGTYSTDPINNLNLNWKYKVSLLDPRTWFDKKPEMIINEVIVDSIDLKRRERFCPARSHLQSDSTILLNHCR